MFSLATRYRHSEDIDIDIDIDIERHEKHRNASVFLHRPGSMSPIKAILYCALAANGEL